MFAISTELSKTSILGGACIDFRITFARCKVNAGKFLWVQGGGVHRNSFDAVQRGGDLVLVFTRGQIMSATLDK